MMADSRGTQHSLHQTWLAFARLIAVTAGALTASVSLLCDVSLLVACGRGAMAWLGVRILARFSAALLAWAARQPQRVEDTPPQQERAG